MYSSLKEISHNEPHYKAPDFVSYQSSFRALAKSIWNKEYSEQRSIPSSHRVEPSHAIISIEQDVNYNNMDVLDLGCGNGRNSIYMAGKGANVIALDFSEVAIGLLERTMEYRRTSGSVVPINHDICNGLPFDDESKDIIVDSYCLCHFVDICSVQKAMNECMRVLRPGGKFIKIHLDVDDPYYLERIEYKTEFGHVSYDVANNINKAHFSNRTYNEYVARELTQKSFNKIEFFDLVRGIAYKRSVFVSILEK